MRRLWFRGAACVVHAGMRRALPVVAIVLAACGRLEFDPPDGGTLDICPAPCIVSAAAAFDGTASGAGQRWGYFGDRRDHTWQPMAALGSAMVGELANRIERCTDRPQLDACRALPGALLVTTTGAASASDPAIEYRPPEARVVRLALRVHVPAGTAAHLVRLYRNSREDVLFTAFAEPGITLVHDVILDALPIDRWVVALEAQGSLGGAAAVHLFLSDASMAFPSTCKLAVGFSDLDIIGPAVDDLCGGAMTSLSGTQPTGPVLSDAPFAHHAQSLYLSPGFTLYGSRPLDRDETTVQFWVRPASTASPKSVVFSDVDERTAHGLLVQLDGSSGLEAAVVTQTSPVTYTRQRIDFSAGPTTWRFVRVVHAAGVVTFCVDGKRAASLPLPSAPGPGTLPYLGKNGPWNPSNDFTGSLDDVRVFSTALPCND